MEWCSESPVEVETSSSSSSTTSADVTLSLCVCIQATWSCSPVSPVASELSRLWVLRGAAEACGYLGGPATGR